MHHVQPPISLRQRLWLFVSSYVPFRNSLQQQELRTKASGDCRHGHICCAGDGGNGRRKVPPLCEEAARGAEYMDARRLRAISADA